jgi:hypothetical protein
VLINGIQEQQELINDLQKQMVTMQDQINDQQKQIDKRFVKDEPYDPHAGENKRFEKNKINV